MIRNNLRVQPELLLVAEAEGELLGAVVAGFDGVRGWIYHLAVLHEFRLQSIATALVRKTEEELAALGCPKIDLQVRAENADAGYDVDQRVSTAKLLSE